MTLTLSDLLFGFVMEDVDFGELALSVDNSLDFRRACVCACLHIALVVSKHKNFEFDLCAHFRVDFFDLDEHIFLDFVLLAAAFHYCVNSYLL